jgi:flagellum-specific ATP synthase
MAELIRLGAYKAGANAEVDAAIKLNPQLDAFLTQKKDERATLAEGYGALEKIVSGGKGRAA